MKQTSCNRIKDLLPLYADGVVSEETAQIVADHLAECPDCRAEYEQMQQTLELPANPELRKESIHALKRIKHQLKHKNYSSPSFPSWPRPSSFGAASWSIRMSARFTTFSPPAFGST